MTAGEKLRRSLLFRGLVVAPSVLVAAYFILWACAPPATLPLQVPMFPGQTREVGIAANAVVNPLVPELDSNGTPTGYVGPKFEGVNGQVWYSQQIGPNFDLGTVAFAGKTSSIGAGLVGRYRFLNGKRWTVGAELQAGLLWLAAGVPISFQLNDKLFLYTNPSIGYRLEDPVRVPVGIAYRAKRFVVGADLAGVWSGGNPAVTAGVSAAMRF